MPAGVVWFFTFAHVDAAARGGWPMLAIAGAVWLLFANSVRHGGLMLWQERSLLRDGMVPSSHLLAGAAVFPIALFAVHLSLIRLALSLGGGSETWSWIAVGLAGVVAAATGFGIGILASRLSGLRPAFVHLAAKDTARLPDRDAGLLYSFRTRERGADVVPDQSAMRRR